MVLSLAGREGQLLRHGYIFSKDIGITTLAWLYLQQGERDSYFVMVISFAGVEGQFLSWFYLQHGYMDSYFVMVLLLSGIWRQLLCHSSISSRDIGIVTLPWLYLQKGIGIYTLSWFYLQQGLRNSYFDMVLYFYIQQKYKDSYFVMVLSLAGLQGQLLCPGSIFRRGQGQLLCHGYIFSMDIWIVTLSWFYFYQGYGDSYFVIVLSLAEIQRFYFSRLKFYENLNMKQAYIYKNNFHFQKFIFDATFRLGKVKTKLEKSYRYTNIINKQLIYNNTFHVIA